MSESKTNTKARQPRAARCPICKATFDRDAAEHYPFCGKRCRQIDLAKWIDGSYVISRPIEQSDLDEGE